MCVCVCMLSCIQLFVMLWTATFQAPMSMGFPRQEYWSGLPFPPPGYLPDPGIEPMSLASPMLAGEFFTTESPGKPILWWWWWWKKEDSVLSALLNLAFFSLQYTLKIIHCPYIFVNVNEVIPNAFPIIKIATLKIIVLCICSVIFID